MKVHPKNSMILYDDVCAVDETDPQKLSPILLISVHDYVYDPVSDVHPAT